MDDQMNVGQENDLDELAGLFGQTEDEYDKIEKTILNKNLDGFASCFPNWDLHPPVIIRTPAVAAPAAQTHAGQEQDPARDEPEVLPEPAPVQETGTRRRKR